ncbi:hypothetical protein [Flavisphingomonas formosensis]|uniref:hypothetical protein n=1 Tax=Flavisphingomonas formosensis TaxID=861534 RepID=UPI0012FABE93|nr:hypothetical protein [Sphingomonas formosensis]
MPSHSPLRARLASFEHAYLLAIRLRTTTGHHQFVVRTYDRIQPVRVVSDRPAEPAHLLAEVR